MPILPGISMTGTRCDQRRHFAGVRRCFASKYNSQLLGFSQYWLHTI
jgi:hypothetical protein